MKGENMKCKDSMYHTAAEATYERESSQTEPLPRKV